VKVRIDGAFAAAITSEVSERPQHDHEAGGSLKVNSVSPIRCSPGWR